MVKVGSGKYTYELVEGWAKLPPGWVLGQTGVVTDSQDRVYLFNRSDHPLVVLDRDGNFLTSWGEGVLVDAHGMHVDADDNLYLPVKDAHVVLKFDSKGNLLMTLGTWNEPSDTGVAHGSGPGQPGSDGRSVPVDRPGGPFNMPSDVSLSPTGDLYISDGYANCQVHKFTADGRLLFSWGQPGKFAPGAFHTPHGVWVHKDGRVFVADRENDRVQIFSPEGNFLEAWTGLRRPCGFYIDQDDTVYIPELRAFISILSIDGRVLARFDGPGGTWPHGDSAHALWVDSHGDLYVNHHKEGDRILKYKRVGV